MTSSRLRLARVAAPLLAGSVALGSAGCAAASPDAGAGSGRLAAVASVYPLAPCPAEIGGAHVRVLNLTKPGAEPHDLELTPRDVGAVSKARVVVYENGLQPAADEAVAQEAPDRALDVADAAQLDLPLTPNDSGEPHADAAGTDPHFWLDPVRYSAVAQAVADRLTRLDPGHR